MSTKRPNILWLMTDEQRCDSMGCYDSSWARTPNLDSLAEQGVVFETAITPAPVCQPARAAMSTGCYPSHTDIWSNNTRPELQLFHLTHVFEAAGYRTASFGKQHYAGSEKAYQTEVGRTYSDHVHAFYYREPHVGVEHGMVRYPPEPYPWIFAGRFPSGEEETAEHLNVDDGINWLRDHNRQAPFFLRVSVNAPHTPVVTPVPFDECIDKADIKLPEGAEILPDGAPDWISKDLARKATSDRLDKADWPQIRQCYYGLVSYVDNQFGRVIDYLRDEGLLEDTIVVYCSDHGTHLGDFGLVQKQTFFEPVVNVPFFVSCPKHLAAGVRIKTPVEVLSILPTLIDLAGLELPAHCDGVSLATTLKTGHEPADRPIFSEFTLDSFNLRHGDRLVMVRHGDWKLALCLDPQPCDGWMVNVADDPDERENRFDSNEHEATRDRLVALIDSHVGESEAKTPPYLSHLMN